MDMLELIWVSQKIKKYVFVGKDSIPKNICVSVLCTLKVTMGNDTMELGFLILIGMMPSLNGRGHLWGFNEQKSGRCNYPISLTDWVLTRLFQPTKLYEGTWLVPRSLGMKEINNLLTCYFILKSRKLISGGQNSKFKLHRKDSKLLIQY